MSPAREELFAVNDRTIPRPAETCPKCAHPAHPRLNCEECFDSGIVASPCIRINWRLHDRRKAALPHPTGEDGR